MNDAAKKWVIWDPSIPPGLHLLAIINGPLDSILVESSTRMKGFPGSGVTKNGSPVVSIVFTN